MDHSEDFITSAFDKTLFSVFSIVLFVLDTKWFIQMPIIFILQFLSNVYFLVFKEEEEDDHSSEESHGGIDITSVLQVEIFTLFIAIMSYFLRKAKI